MSSTGPGRPVIRGERPGPRSGGFTLVEVLLVMTIVAVLATMLAPRMSGSYHLSRFKQGPEKIAELIRYYRARAISDHVTYIINFDFDYGTVEAARSDEEEIGTNYRYSRIPSRSDELDITLSKQPVSFYPDGTIDYFSIVFEDIEGRACSLAVNPYYGSPSLYYYDTEYQPTGY